MIFTYKKHVLDSGVKVVSESSRDAGSIAVGFWIGVGASSEPPELGGASHFIEHILFKGTRKRSAFQIAHALESVGGSIDALTGREVTAFVSRCLPEHLRRAVEVISDMLCHPEMRKKAIEIEKKVIIEEIRNFEDTPEEIVHELLSKSVWKSNPLGNSILGTVESVRRLRRGTIRPFFQGTYVSPNVIVAATGKVNHNELVDYVGKVLKLPGRPASSSTAASPEKVPRIFKNKRKVAQCYVCLGVEAPSYVDRRRYASVLLSVIVGGGMTSRLFQQVREQQGLAYSVYSSCEFYRKTGMFYIFLAVDPKKARRAVRSVSEELKRLKTGGLRKGELRSAKQQLKGNLILGMESTSARMSRLARQEFYLGDYMTAEESLKMAMGVRSARVMDEADRILDSKRFSLTVVGPASTNFPSAGDIAF
jgi:predicted Zn-dependent peptidase